jgi:hypothetical protein
MLLYTCFNCANGNHKDCSLTTPPPIPNSLGGSKCVCPCKGRDMEQVAKDNLTAIRKRIKQIHEFNELSRELIMGLNPCENCTEDKNIKVEKFLDFFYVLCYNCHATTKEHKTEISAIREWNENNRGD